MEVEIAAADTTPTSTAFDDPLTWINFGVLGILVFLLLTGWLWSKPSVERIDAENKRLVVERDNAIAKQDAVTTMVQDKLLPLISDMLAAGKSLPTFVEIQRLQQIILDLDRHLQRGEDRGPERRSG